MHCAHNCILAHNHIPYPLVTFCLVSLLISHFDGAVFLLWNCIHGSITYLQISVSTGILATVCTFNIGNWLKKTIALDSKISIVKNRWNDVDDDEQNRRFWKYGIQIKSQHLIGIAFAQSNGTVTNFLGGCMLLCVQVCVCSVCVYMHGNQYRSPYRIFEFLIWIRQFLDSHFPTKCQTAHTHTRAIRRKNFNICGTLCNFMCFSDRFSLWNVYFPRIVCGVPTKKRKETGDRKNNHTIQAEENGKRLSIFRTCRKGIMWWADELKTSE